MKPKFHTSKLRSQHTIGASLITAITICFTSSAFAVDNFWTGTTSTDWNTATNWSLGRVPANPNGNVAPADTFDDAVVNISSPVAKITANVPTPRDFRVGQGAGTNGRVDHSAGSASTGGGNWAFIGRQGGTGVYNLADTSVVGTGVSGFGQGSGSFTCNGSRLYVGGANGETPVDGNGKFNMNTTGSLTIGSDLTVGSGTGAVGVFNVDSGSITTGGWNFVGKNENGQGANGTLNMAGGTLTNTGRTYIGQEGSTGALNLSGGSYKDVNQEIFVVGENNASHGSVTISNAASTLQTGSEFWIGQGAGSNGHVTLSAGLLDVRGWLQVGRGGGNGLFDMTGGTITKTGGGYFLIADGSTGVMNLSGGTVAVNSQIWVGQAAGGNGTLNFSAGTITNGSWVAVGREGGTGLVTMTGGSWTKTGDGAFIVGASGPGTINQSDGLIDVQSGDTWMAEGNTANYSLTGGEFRASTFQVARNAGSVGNINLDGGTLRANQIIGGGGTENIHFNGTQIFAKSTQANFINAIDTNKAIIDGGGLKINSNGFSIGSTQAFIGTGGVTKSGVGTLTLSGGSSNTGANSVLEGKLVVTTANTGSGGFTLANGAELGVRQTSNTASLTVPSATFGTTSGTTLEIDLGNFAGNPTVAPLTVTGTLALNGTVTINVADSLPAVGMIPLVAYTGSTSVAANFVLGTLPNGVVATLDKTTTPGVVFLNVTSASTPLWKGYVDGKWDTTTPNWLEQVSNTPNSLYANPAPVLFNDTASQTLVTLAGTVSPSKVTFNNSTLGYFLSGAGKISGSASFLKQGTASLSLLTTNDYTGTSTFEGGSTTINVLANGGSPSSIGASSAAPSNLVLAGGTLNYTGPAITINRGFSIAGANSGLSNTNALTLSGPVVTTVGGFIKAGDGNLTLTNAGVNGLSATGQVARVNGGTLTLDGTAGGQNNIVLGELWTGTTPDVAADLVLTNTTLTVSSWIAMGRGNGTTGADTKITATGSTILSTNFSTGFDGGIALNDSDQFVTLTNTTWTNAGGTNLAESLGASTDMTLAGTSVYSSVGDSRLAGGPNTVVNLVIGGSSTYTAASFQMAAGANAIANLTLSGTASLTTTTFPVAGGAGSTANITIGGNSTVQANGQFQMGLNAVSSATMTIQDSGKLTKTGGWFSIGNDGTGSVIVKNSGTLTADGDFNVSDVGTSIGTLTIQDTAVVTSTGGAVFIAKNDGTTGTVNLNGGRLIAKRVFGNNSGGNGTFNFNGGVLEASTGLNVDFLSGIDHVVVQVGGGTIDTAANVVNIGQSFEDNSTNGTIKKVGTGTLNMNGYNTYAGDTIVDVGTLGGSGRLGGNLVVNANATVNPGAGLGTLSVAGNVTFAANTTLATDIGAQQDTLAVDGNLNITNVKLVINGTPSAPVYVVASYGTLTGAAFAGPLPTLPAGYSIDYNYQGSNQIVLKRATSPFENWIGNFFPGETNQSIVGPAADPDGDGSSNILEFALGGSPEDGTNGPKVYHIEADGSVDAGTNKELLMTIAVRKDTPAFIGSPSPAATKDGVNYTIQGSTDLAGFTTGVTVVNVVTPASNPTPPTDYVYRTFSLNGSDTLPNKGFLRVKVD